MSLFSEPTLRFLPLANGRDLKYDYGVSFFRIGLLVLYMLTVLKSLHAQFAAEREEPKSSLRDICWI